MPDIIQSVDRALEVMIYLHHQGKETSITKIAADLGVYKSTVYRTLVTLENRGFVYKNPKTEKYWLGNRLFVLGKGVEKQMSLPEVVRPYARKLFDAYGLAMTFEQYVLVGSTVRSYLAWLKDTGRVAARFEKNLLLWERM